MPNDDRCLICGHALHAWQDGYDSDEGECRVLDCPCVTFAVVSSSPTGPAHPNHPKVD